MKEKFTMKNLFLLLIIPICLSIHADAGKWKKYEYINQNTAPTAYKLKKNVLFMEMRIYEVDKNYRKRVKRGYEINWKAYREPLESFDKKLVRQFKATAPNLSSQTDILKYSDAYSLDGRSNKHYFIANVFYIDADRKIWRMNTNEDVLSFVLPIDNSVDLSFVLWMKTAYTVKSYRRVSQGYEVRVKERDEMNADEKKCGIYNYRILIDRNGMIRKKVFEKFTPMGCSVI